MDNLIFNAFYSVNGKSKSINNTNSSAISAYLKNSMVSLYSAKINNPDCKVVLYTNEQVPDEFEKYGIEIRILPFNDYKMPDGFKWSYAYYKLCCLKDAVNREENDNILLLDTDTYIPYPLKSLWLELKISDSIMLYNTQHNIEHPVRQQICTDYNKIYGGGNAIPQYGGEFVAGSINGLKELINTIDNVYTEIKLHDFDISDDAGDEELLSMAAFRYCKKIQDASPYIQRYWTRSTYLVSTNWKIDNVLVWHLPAEKNLGLCDIYKYIRRTGSIPEIKTAASLCNLPKANMPLNIQYIKRMFYKIANLKNYKRGKEG